MIRIVKWQGNTADRLLVKASDKDTGLNSIDAVMEKKAVFYCEMCSENIDTYND